MVINSRHAATTSLSGVHRYSTACMLYYLYTAYSLYLPPIHCFPGPRLAAASSLHEFWYDVIKMANISGKSKKMHERFARVMVLDDVMNSGLACILERSIVWLNPRELHICDLDYFSTIYAGGTRKVDKDTKIGAALGLPKSIVATIGHHHRSRRGYLNPYFPRKAMTPSRNMTSLSHNLALLSPWRRTTSRLCRSF